MILLEKISSCFTSFLRTLQSDWRIELAVCVALGAILAGVSTLGKFQVVLCLAGLYSFTKTVQLRIKAVENTLDALHSEVEALKYRLAQALGDVRDTTD